MQKKKEKTVREWAYEALLAVERNGMQSHLVIRDTLQKMQSGRPNVETGNSRDRAFFVRLVEGTIEYRLQLDYVIDVHSKTKTKKMRPGVREILRMAVYQILYMDSVPDRAAVNEAVDLAVQKGFAGLRGFVNGVLRTVVREKSTFLPFNSEFGETGNVKGSESCLQSPWPDRRKDPVRALSVRYSIPEEILKAWIPRYGEDKTEEICRAFLEDRPLSVHWFSSDISAEAAKAGEAIEAAGPGAHRKYLTPTGILENSFFLKSGVEPSKTPDFRNGTLYVQDLSSQIAVAAADIRPGDRVLDLCAAPGGKSLLATERGAKVLARDLTEEKVSLIRENAARLHLLKDERGIHAESADACIYDPEQEGIFDVVIADLPCSGFGVAGRKPEIKYKSYRKTVTALAELQRTILANGVRYVRPGGKLLYSTCTIAVEENEENVKWLFENSDLRPAEFSEPVRELLRTRDIPATEYGVQLLPCDGPWDGFFFALLQRKSG